MKSYIIYMYQKKTGEIPSFFDNDYTLNANIYTRSFVLTFFCTNLQKIGILCF